MAFLTSLWRPLGPFLLLLILAGCATIPGDPGDLHYGFGDPEFCDDGATLLVGYRDNAGRRICRVDVVSGVVLPLTTGARFDFDSRISADRKTLVFASCAGGNHRASDIYEIDIASGRIERLVKGEGSYLHSPAVSDDGRSVIYIAANGQKGAGQLFQLTRDTGQLAAISEPALGILYPAFDSNGNIIYWRSQIFYNSSPIATPAWHDWVLVRQALGGMGMPQPTTRDPRYRISWPRVAPNGRWTVFGTGDSTSYGSLWMVDLEGATGEQPVYPIGQLPESFRELGLRKGDFVEPFISDDGRSVLFAVSRDASSYVSYATDILLWIRSDNTVRHIVHTNDSVSQPVLSGDGRTVAFITCEKPESRFARRKLWVCGVDGLGLREIKILHGE